MGYEIAIKSSYLWALKFAMEAFIPAILLVLLFLIVYINLKWGGYCVDIEHYKCCYLFNRVSLFFFLLCMKTDKVKALKFNNRMKSIYMLGKNRFITLASLTCIFMSGSGKPERR
jgi:hypothetical protein